MASYPYPYAEIWVPNISISIISNITTTTTTTINTAGIALLGSGYDIVNLHTTTATIGGLVEEHISVPSG